MGSAIVRANRDTAQHSNGGETWTVMVYMAADNNLEYFALQDLEEMAQGLQDSNLQIVVQVDRAEGYESTGLRNLPDFTDTKRIRVKSDAFEILEEMGETKTGAPSTLSDFIVWGAQAAPADRYALFLWNHGSGWPGFGGDDSVAGEDSELTLKELDDAIGDGRSRAELPEFAIIGFDACLMATLETVRALERHTELMLASEELEPGDGWDYRALSIFAKSPGADAVAIGKAIQQGFVTGRKLSDVTLSLTDTFHIAKVHTALDALGAAILKEDPETVTAVARAQAQAASFMMGGIDFGDFARRVENFSTNLAGPAREVDEALRDAVVARLSGIVHSATTGLTVYFPPNADQYESGYDNIAHMESWRAFLKSYYALPALKPPPALAFQTIEVGEPNGLGIRDVSATLSPGTGGSVSFAHIATGIGVPGVSGASGSTQILSLDPTTISGDSISGKLSDISLVARQGETETFFYADLTEFDIINGTGVLRTPVQIQLPGEAQTANWGYVENAVEDWWTTQTRYYVRSSAGVGEVAMSDGAQLFAAQLFQTVGGHMSGNMAAPIVFSIDNPVSFEVGYLPFDTQLTTFVIAYTSSGQSVHIAASFQH